MKRALWPAIAVGLLMAPAALAAPPKMTHDHPVGSVFKCGEGRELAVEFITLDSIFVARVDAGDGAHVLPISAPPEPGPVQIVWSDGQRTLTWSAGVSLMWMDGEGAHMMCGRGEHKH